VHHIEDRIVGLKVRGVYEQPAAHAIILAHKHLEKYVCTRLENKFKELVDQEWAYLCYAGLWYEPLMKDISGFVDTLNEKVNGSVTLRLYKGNCEVVAVKTPDALFDEKLATFNKNALFNQNASPGFIELWTLQMKMAKQTKKNVLFTGEEIPVVIKVINIAGGKFDVKLEYILKDFSNKEILRVEDSISGDSTAEVLKIIKTEKTLPAGNYIIEALLKDRSNNNVAVAAATVYLNSNLIRKTSTDLVDISLGSVLPIILMVVVIILVGAAIFIKRRKK